MADDDRTPETCTESSLSKAEIRKQKARERTRAWNAANKERKQAADRAYREANPERIKEEKRAYYIANKDRVKADNKEWQSNNRNKVKEIKQAYYEANKERIKAEERSRHDRQDPAVLKAKRQAYYKANEETIKAKTKAWRSANPERRKETSRAWEEANRETLNERYRERRRRRYAERRATDPAYRIRKNLSATLNQAFRLQSLKKRNSTIELIGCSIVELKAHLEAQFLPGMSWENYGYRGWHIDHRIPCASFDLTDPVQQKICFHWSNLQPLWREDNQRKSASLDWQPSHQVAPRL